MEPKSSSQQTRHSHRFLLGTIGFIAGYPFPIICAHLFPNSLALLAVFSAILICAGVFAKSLLFRAMYQGFWRGVLVSFLISASIILRTRTHAREHESQAFSQSFTQRPNPSFNSDPAGTGCVLKQFPWVLRSR